MATIDKVLCQQLNQLAIGDIDTIIKAHRDAKRRGIPVQDYIDQIPPAKLKALSPEQHQLLRTGEPMSVTADALDAKNPMLMMEIAENLLQNFKMSEAHGQLFLYEITEEKNKVVRPIYDGDPESILIRHMSCQWLETTGEPLPPATANALYKMWFNHIKPIPRPVPMGRPGTDHWCLHRPSIQPDAAKSYDSWQAILNRMDDPEAFAAWVAGVYFGWYKGRQVLWLYGPHGEDGKSTISKVIGTTLFGPAYAALSNSSLSANETRFLTSYFEEAELICYPDASNRKCLMSETFKSIASAGTDPVLIERKNKQAYTTVLKARLWVNSNFPPAITGDNFMTSRLLMVTLTKMVNERPDPTVVERLKDELPGFLAYAINAYSTKCTRHYRIDNNAKGTESVQELAEEFFEEYEIIFSKHWRQADQSCRVDGSVLRDTLKREGLLRNVEAKNFVDWMIQYKGVNKRKLSSENGRIFYYGLCTYSSPIEQNTTSPALIS